MFREKVSANASNCRQETDFGSGYVIFGSFGFHIAKIKTNL
jgi:hypothetical protein